MINSNESKHSRRAHARPDSATVAIPAVNIRMGRDSQIQAQAARLPEAGLYVLTLVRGAEDEQH
jgi:hypothetical protein